MLKNQKDKLFYIGLFIMGAAFLLEHTVPSGVNLVDFLKGFACGLMLVGSVVLFIKGREKALAGKNALNH